MATKGHRWCKSPLRLPGRRWSPHRNYGAAPAPRLLCMGAGSEDTTRACPVDPPEGAKPARTEATSPRPADERVGWRHLADHPRSPDRPLTDRRSSGWHLQPEGGRQDRRTWVDKLGVVLVRLPRWGRGWTHMSRAGLTLTSSGLGGVGTGRGWRSGEDWCGGEGRSGAGPEWGRGSEWREVERGRGPGEVGRWAGSDRLGLCPLGTAPSWS